MQAIKAMKKVDVFFVIGKGAEKQELVDLRMRILGEHLSNSYELVRSARPPRDRRPADYAGEVDDWHERRAAVARGAFAACDGVGGYCSGAIRRCTNSTLRTVERVLARERISFEYEVIPGVMSLSALGRAASGRAQPHRRAVPRHHGPSAARRPAVPDAAVMLDADCSFFELPPRPRSGGAPTSACPTRR